MAVSNVSLGGFDISAANHNTWGHTFGYFRVPNVAGNLTGVKFIYSNIVSPVDENGWCSLEINDTSVASGVNIASGRSLSTSHFTKGAEIKVRVVLTALKAASTRWWGGAARLEFTFASNPGTLTLNKTSMDAGETVRVSLGKADAGITRTVKVYFGNESEALDTIVTNTNRDAKYFDWEFPIERCDKMPSATQGTIKFTMTPSQGSVVNKTMTITVPAAVVPTMGDFTAEMVRNGVPEDIAGYVQNKSKCLLSIIDAEGAYGSTISAYKITGGGLDKNEDGGTYGPFNLIGDITFTAKITDTRGRTATETVTIVMLAWETPKLMEASAYRADEVGVKDTEGFYVRMISGISFSALDGDNVATLKGRVFQKGGTPPAWTAMTPGAAWIAGGGLISVDRTYVCEIRVDDLLGYAMMSFDIPTKKTPISFLARALGLAFGKVAETPGIVDSALPIYINGKRVLTEDDLPL